MQSESKIHTYSGDAIMTSFLMLIFFVAFLTLWLSACSPSAAQVKKDIAADLTQISQTADCPTACEALKLYIKTKLGGL